MAKQSMNAFKKAVDATPQIKNCYEAGLKALGAHRSKIEMSNTSFCDGSVEIDKCVLTIYPQDNRWDYSFGYNGKAYFVEVHTASTSEVGTVIKKLEWLKDWLVQKAPELNKIKAEVPFYWIQSGRYDILPNSSQAREIARKGIKPIPKLVLK